MIHTYYFYLFLVILHHNDLVNDLCSTILTKIYISVGLKQCVYKIIGAIRWRARCSPRAVSSAERDRT